MPQQINSDQHKRLVKWCADNKVELPSDVNAKPPVLISRITDTNDPRIELHYPMYQVAEIGCGTLDQLDAAIDAMGFDLDNLPPGLGGEHAGQPARFGAPRPKPKKGRTIREPKG